MDDSNSKTFASGYFFHSQIIKITRILWVCERQFRALLQKNNVSHTSLRGYVTRRYCCFQVSSVLESLLSAFTHRSQNTGYSNPVLAPLSLSRNVGREGPSLLALRDREREGPELDNGYSCWVMKISNKLHQVHVTITIIIFRWFLQEHYQNYLRMISSIYSLSHDSRLKLF